MENENNNEGFGPMNPWVKLLLSLGGLFLISKLFASVWGMIDWMISVTMVFVTYAGFILCGTAGGRALYQILRGSVESTSNGIGDWMKKFFSSMVSDNIFSIIKERENLNPDPEQGPKNNEEAGSTQKEESNKKANQRKTG